MGQKNGTTILAGRTCLSFRQFTCTHPVSEARMCLSHANMVGDAACDGQKDGLFKVPIKKSLLCGRIEAASG